MIFTCSVGEEVVVLRHESLKDDHPQEMQWRRRIDYTIDMSEEDLEAPYKKHKLKYPTLTVQLH